MSVNEKLTNFPCWFSCISCFQWRTCPLFIDSNNTEIILSAFNQSLNSCNKDMWFNFITLEPSQAGSRPVLNYIFSNWSTSINIRSFPFNINKVIWYFYDIQWSFWTSWNTFKVEKKEWLINTEYNWNQ